MVEISVPSQKLLGVLGCGITLERGRQILPMLETHREKKFQRGKSKEIWI